MERNSDGSLIHYAEYDREDRHDSGYTDIHRTGTKKTKSVGGKSGTARGRKGFAAAIFVSLIFIMSAVVSYFFVHVYNTSSCTSPATCIICGKTEGKPLGHDWIEASCLEKQHCKRCGLEQGSALGHKWSEADCQSKSKCRLCGITKGAVGNHKWVAASYDRSQYCSVCGRTSGVKKGIVTDYSVSVSDTKINLRGSQTTRPFIFSKNIYDCFRMSIEIEVTDYSGNPFGTWYLYTRRTNGSWEHTGTFYFDEAKAQNRMYFDFEFDHDISINAVSFFKQDSSLAYSIDYNVAITEVQQRVS